MEGSPRESEAAVHVLYGQHKNSSLQISQMNKETLP